VSAEWSVTFGGNFVDESNREAFDRHWGDYQQAMALTQQGIFAIQNAGSRPKAQNASPVPLTTDPDP